MYYAVSDWGTINSAIGVATSPSLANPTWTDQGKVVESNYPATANTDTTAYNMIDPSILVDSTTNDVWMSYGSYSSGILISQINPSTGKLLQPISDATLVANNAPGGGWGSTIEASYLMQEGGYYYLFVNYGGCCDGVSSTYNIREGRSTSPTGPFYDQNGVPMTESGGSMFLQDNGNEIGPGQFGYLHTSSQDYFSYHYYDGNADGAPTFALQKLYWINGWPSAAPVNSSWAGGANATWSSTANWSAEGVANGAVPNADDNTANFGANSAGGYTVGLSTGQTVTTINFTGDSSYTIGSTTGNHLTLVADTGAASTINVADDATQTINAPITAQTTLEVNVKNSDSDLVLAGNISGSILTEYGFGTVSIGGTDNFTGNVFIHEGTLNITGSVTASSFTSIGQIVGDTGTMTVQGNGSFTANGDLNVGDTGNDGTPATGTLNIANSATVTVNSGGGFFVGSGFYASTSSVGTVNQTGGTLTVSDSADGDFIIGGRTSNLAVGTYNLGGGTVNADTNVRVGGYGTGTMDQTGGIFNAPDYVSIGRFAGATGVWNLSGGALNVTGPQLIVGEAGNGTFTVSGTGAATLKAALQLGRDAGGAGIVNLDGGNVTAPQVVLGSGTGTLFFSGGILTSSASSTTFMQGLTDVYIQAGGALLNAQAFSDTIAQPLLHATSLGSTPDGGLTKTGSGILTLTGANTFTGDTYVNAGTLTVTGTGATLDGAPEIADGSGLTATMNIGSGVVVTAGSQVGVGTSGGNGTLNLNGGTLAVTQVTGGSGTSTLNFNGGTLQAYAGASANFVTGLTQISILAGGAKIDSNGQNITIAQNLLSGGGIDGGLSKLGGAGTLTLTGTNTYTGPTNVQNGTLLIAAAGALPTNTSVSITGGTLKLAKNTGDPQLASLSISGNGTLDIGNNTVFINYPAGSDPIAAIRGYIVSGFDTGYWTGNGITSSSLISGGNYGVGYADGADGVVAGLSSGQIEIKYTLLGDANLDGTVNGSDFSILAANFGTGATNWDQGNFLYGSSVNGSDFSALAANFGQGDSGADVAVSEADVAALDAFAVANGLPLPVIGSVPEPAATLSMGAMICAALSRRLRRVN